MKNTCVLLPPVLRSSGCSFSENLNIELFSPVHEALTGRSEERLGVEIGV